MYIDTHCHISKYEYENIFDVIEKLGNNLAIISGADLKTSKEVLELVNKYPNLYGTVGIHPNETEDFTDESLEFIKQAIKNKKIVGIGEIGLDYHYEKNENQKDFFIKQLQLARKYNKPVVIHSRDAAEDTINIIKDYFDLKISFHCFSYSKQIAEYLIKNGVKLGIGGVLTFKNSKNLKEIVKSFDLSSFLIETDSPYLSPEPLRGTINIPSNVIYVAKKIAEIKNESEQNVLKETLNNAINQFDLDI